MVCAASSHHVPKLPTLAWLHQPSQAPAAPATPVGAPHVQHWHIKASFWSTAKSEFLKSALAMVEAEQLSYLYSGGYLYTVSKTLGHTQVSPAVASTSSVDHMIRSLLRLEQVFFALHGSSLSMPVLSAAQPVSWVSGTTSRRNSSWDKNRAAILAPASQLSSMSTRSSKGVPGTCWKTKHLL